MALLSGMFPWQGGLLGGLPEIGGPGGYERLPPELEAQLAQEARDAAARRLGARGNLGGADMSLWNDAGPTLTQQIMPTAPGMSEQPAQTQVPAQAPALPAPTNGPAMSVAGIPTDISTQSRAPMSLAPPEPQIAPRAQVPVRLVKSAAR